MATATTLTAFSAEVSRNKWDFVENLFTSFSLTEDVKYTILPIVSLVVVILTSTFTLKQSTIAQSETWQNLTRLDYGLQYPSDWTLQPDISGEGVILKPNIGGVVLEFNIQDIWEPFSKALADAKSGSGFKLTELDNNTFVSGHPAVKVVGESPYLDKTMAILSQFGGKIYTINYYGSPEAYNTFLPTAQQIIDSFNVTETATGNQTNSNMTNG